MTETESTWKHILRALESSEEVMKYNIKRNHNCQQLFKSIAYFDYDVISSFPNSPTAMKYKEAYEIFEKAQSILYSYSKETVDNEDDCNFLQPAFQGYAKGEMCENHLFVTFAPPKHSLALINQYLSRKPSDVLAEYFKICFMKEHHLLPPTGKLSSHSEYKHMKKLSSAHEKFALKLESKNTALQVNKEILLKMNVEINFMLGSFYSITDQNIRALESFKKAYSYDLHDLDSLYGVAFYQQFFNRDECVRLLKIFIQRAPKCHKRYYDAFYTLSLVHITHYKDIRKAKKYFKLGEKAEENQLPFLPVNHLLSKDNVRMLLSGEDFVSNLM